MVAKTKASLGVESRAEVSPGGGGRGGWGERIVNGDFEHGNRKELPTESIILGLRILHQGILGSAVE